MTNLVSLLLECAERLEEGLESEQEMEAEWSKAGRALIARIRSAVEPTPERDWRMMPITGSSEAGPNLDHEPSAVYVDQRLAWHDQGCVKRYGAVANTPCACELRRAQNR